MLAPNGMNPVKDTNSTSYSLLIEKLDTFIRKFYVNSLLRGTLLFVGAIILLLICFSVAEHFFYFTTSVRQILFYSFLLSGLVAFIYLIGLPLLSYMSLGKTISYEEASKIIGTHFSDVQDKLLNVLQLKNQDTGSSDLISASIDQKINDLNPVPFKKAVDLSENKKYLKYTLPPVLLLLVLLLSSNIIESGTSRIIKNKEHFEKPALFKIELKNKNLETVQYSDYTVNVSTEGEVSPSEMFINIDNYQFKMSKSPTGDFNYTFKNVQKDVDFFFESTGIQSKPYGLEIIKKPSLAAFRAVLDYPAYTGKNDEIVENIGDFVVLAGTKIKWDVTTKNADHFSYNFNGGKKVISKESEKVSFEKRIIQPTNYKLFYKNQKIQQPDSVEYSINVIPDLYPTIDLKLIQDSSNTKVTYCYGEVTDDYGISSLQIVGSITKGKQTKGFQKPITFIAGKESAYEYILDVESLGLETGDKLTYYFEVFDNDGVQGKKSTKTQTFQFEMPTKAELKKKTADNSQSIKDELKKSKEAAKELQDELKELKKNILEKKEVDWKTKKELEKLKEKQSELDKQIEEAKKKFQENMKLDEILDFEKKDEIVKKQEKINELFEELMNDEMQDMMKELEKLMEDFNKDEMLEQLDETELNEEELEDELDRMLELFKQLELENEMKKTVEELEELAEKQEDLSEKTEEQQTPSEELKEEQKEIDKEFEELQKKLDELEEQNQELKKPTDMPNTSDDEKEVEEQLEKSEEQLDNGDSKKASQSQKKAAQKMQQMANNMKSSMEQAEEEAYEEDMAAIRQLLENLVTLSFEQENLIETFSSTPKNTPRYVSLVQDQFKIRDDFKIVEDSLNALASRVFQIQSFVEEKVTEVKSNLQTSITQLEERNTNKAAVNQQRSMKNINDIALMLDESLKQMQQDMASKKSGDQQCEKCNGKGSGKSGKQGKPKLGAMQKQLNDMLKEQLEGMKKGEKPGKGMSKKFAQMAAQQSAMREALRKMKEELQGQGKGKEAKGLEELMNLMDKTEEDLVNKRLTERTLKRQKQIETRLLEHDKAQEERQFDEKRESKTAVDQEKKLPPAIEEYLKQKNSEIKEYRAKEPKLKPYYKKLVESYYNSLKNQPE